MNKHASALAIAVIKANSLRKNLAIERMREGADEIFPSHWRIANESLNAGFVSGVASYEFA